MTTTSRDGQLAALAAAHRDLLLGVATLVYGDSVAAERLVHTVLAHLYAGWPRIFDPVLSAYAGALSRTPLGQPLPWDRPRGFELVDGPPAGAKKAAGLAADLARLDRGDREVIVLREYARLPVADVAAVVGLAEHQVVEAEERARRLLAAAAPRRDSPGELAAELAAAARRPVRVEPAGDDRSAGRRLLIRRRTRGLGAAAVLLVALVAGLRVALPPLLPGPAAAPPPVTSTPTPACDTRSTLCRVQILSAWRSAMAMVVSSHLDPKGTYFSGYSYSYNDSQGFWSGQGGALALDLYRVEDGATEVSLQIATSRRYALRCGELTGQDCFSMRFLDGNRFILTETGTAEVGVEVQQAPAGTYVITVVARKTAKKGRTLDVTTGDLMRLVQDERLQLPPH